MVELAGGKRLLIVLAVCLIAILAFGTAASAATRKVRPTAIFAPDAYESDNDSSTAKVLPETSIHTFETSTTDGYTYDQDWYKISADTTGQPFILDGQFIDCQMNWDPAAYVYKLEADGSLTEVTSQDDWSYYDGFGWRTSMYPRMYFTAPEPGTYFVDVYQDDSPYAPAKYKIFDIAGNARRVGGTNRYETAAEVSRELYPDADSIRDGDPQGPRNIIVATGTNFADALSAVPFAVQEQYAIMNTSTEDYNGAVILLTQPNALPEVTRAEIERLASQGYWQPDYYENDPSMQVHVYVLGGPSAVSENVVDQIKGIRGVDFVDRIAGDNRFATAAEVADLTAEKASDPGYISMGSTVYLVNGFSFADALSAGPVAGFDSSPILLTNASTCPSETIQWMEDNGTTEVVAVGSTSVVADSVLDQIKAAIPSIDTTRVGGANRYETSYDLAVWGIDHGMQGNSSVVVSGDNFPDGLAGGVICGNDGGPLLLTPSNSLSPYIEQFHSENGGFTHSGMLVGGPLAVSDPVYSAYKDLWKTLDIKK